MWRWYFLDDNNWAKTEAELKSWLGTPYLHMHGVKGRGTDCNQFIGSALTIIGIIEYGYSFNYYSPDWYKHTEEQIILKYVREHRANLKDELDYLEMDYEEGMKLMRGDYLGFSVFNNKGMINHSGIYLGDGTFINAIEKRGVCIEELNSYWRRHIKKVIRVFEVI